MMMVTHEIDCNHTNYSMHAPAHLRLLTLIECFASRGNSFHFARAHGESAAHLQERGEKGIIIQLVDKTILDAYVSFFALVSGMLPALVFVIIARSWWVREIHTAFPNSGKIYETRVRKTSCTMCIELANNQVSR